ncbi:MobA/MobL family protein [Bosea sp. (in: a-proteobacteria)]|jgi:hypothetical protein|uniref:MobA/MobL family protein n=1 Tax=Bosea sp. (in: a-proteobacteria) TaxID=1871050 RepID=UPI002DDCC805|nr:MobA/MobL family protein [Bosea sp. (in: a-proteobacteria)]HEV2510347.1 MobA/MobL family protein [Bosea sp. (in: a-proteobacteria)]
MFERTIHFAAKWVRASMADGVHAIGAVSAYVCGKSSFLGRPIDSPHAAHEIAFAGLSMPEGVDLDREDTWVQLDAFERKPDGSYRRNGGHLPRLGTHIDATLPYGMNDAQARRIVEGFARWLTQAHGVVVEYGCHNAATSRDHAHFLVSTRSMAVDSYGAKVRALNGIAMQHKDRETGAAITQQRGDGTVKAISSAMDEMRAEWSRRLGAEIGVTPDHRSFARQGLGIQPVPYINRQSIEFEKRQARRTGTEPSWRVDRRRRLADRVRSLIKDSAPRMVESRDVIKRSAAIHERRDMSPPASTMMRRAILQSAALRRQIEAHGSATKQRLRDAMARLQSAVDGHARETGSQLSSTWRNITLATGPRLRSRVPLEILDSDRGSDERARQLAARQQREADMLLHRQLLSLALIEKLISRHALVALRRLSVYAVRRVAEAKALVEKHDEQWAALLESKRQAWRDIRVDMPARARTGRHRDLDVPASTARLVAERRLAAMQSRIARSNGAPRAELLQQAIAADQRRIIRGRADIDTSTVTALRRIDPRVGRLDPIVVEAAERLGSRWQDGVTRLLGDHGQARVVLLDQYEKHESRLRRGHRHKLALIASIIKIDAFRALRELAVLAKQIAQETMALLDAQGRDWIELMRKQSAEWPSMPAMEAKPRALDPVITQSGDVPLGETASRSSGRQVLERAASPSSQGRTVVPAATRRVPPHPAHVRIVDELAVLMILQGKRSDALKQMLADYVNEDVADFDRRTNARYDLFLKTAQSLGPGQSNPLRPRTLRDIAADAVVRSTPELKDLIEAVVERVARKRGSTAPPRAQRSSAGEAVVKGKHIV